MIREIKYIFDNSVNPLTCHALFSTLTDNGLSKLQLNAYSKQPEYKVSFLDGEIKVLINEKDLPIINIPEKIEFNNQGVIIRGRLISDKHLNIETRFVKNDLVLIKGVLAYSLKKNINGKSQNVYPFNNNGEFVEETKEHTLKYLSQKTGLLLNSIEVREVFLLNKIDFDITKKVYSKSNNKIINLDNIFSLEIIGEVDNKELTNSLDYTSIGKKRDYSFGSLNCRLVS